MAWMDCCCHGEARRRTTCCGGMLRHVPAFTVQAVHRPRRIPIFCIRGPEGSRFRRFLLRGDIPIGREWGERSRKHHVRWHIPPEQLDYQRFLPLFFDGLCEDTFPYRELARHGVADLLQTGTERQILRTVPMLILPMREALNRRNPDIIIATLRALQQLLRVGPSIGPALVPYYRQLLPILNLYIRCYVNIGDAIDFRGGRRLGEVINATLELLEQCGGADAYLNIKYMVPTYESCVYNC
ncbi:parkin coregulated gene protein homolog [Anopheles aquasalis]|uniref:parkin coregulated gene protein homolog n=1 Tax=Anopheles aquasalis TaxID=42839 RepID=UPI00215B09C0|nr:parkin coregulated gene protein homolog [Anopheles aquasalis]